MSAVKIFPAVADDNGVVNVGRKFQKILQVLGGDIFTARRDDQVLFPVCQFEVSFIVNHTNVAGMHPSVDQNFFGLLLILVITLENAGMLHQDFAVFSNFDLCSRQRLANGSHFIVDFVRTCG
ncbi:MAG: hypothetical protein MZV70_23245 [Desulfobacterales bacterium]|nr:hypothetical protein [Desulfobacterales bacterium]